MEKFFADYLDTLEACHNSILETIAGLPEAALDWKPDPEMNSIAVLIYHLTGAERYWIGDVAGETPSGRDRAAEFKVHDVGLDALQSRLAETLAFVRTAAEKLSLASLAEARTSHEGRTVTVAWALLHALEHAGIHRGHIEMTWQLWQDSHGKA